MLSQKDYCYMLANAADLYKAFNDFGWRLFDLNLRYEVRNSSVNSRIVESLRHQRSRRLFHHYNNGLIVVCNSYAKQEQKGVVKITGAQIVNGLQTVKSIYNAVTSKDVQLDQLDSDCRVQVKLIQNADPQFIDNVVQATNNQNPMAPRNLLANTRDQKKLRAALANLQPRWFLQTKEGEWDSLNEEGARFFKQVARYPVSEFRIEEGKKRGRVIDNQDAAKAWLSFVGFSDLAGDRTTHYFERPDVYHKAFGRSPTDERWQAFSRAADFRAHREEMLSGEQGTAEQYLLAVFLLELVQDFVPKPSVYRLNALNEGVKDGRIRKADGEIVSGEREQNEYLAENRDYQTWRMMANMKDVLVEAMAYILARRYGSLGGTTCALLLRGFDAAHFLKTSDTGPIVEMARSAEDLPDVAIFARLLGVLRFSAQQYWEEKKRVLQGVPRLKIYLFSAEAVREFKQIVLECSGRSGISKTWKPEGKSLIDSLPALPREERAEAR